MQKSRRGNGGGKAKAGKAMAGKGKWRGGVRLEARKNRYDQKAALRKSSYQHGSIVFGKITLMPYPALQLAERGKKRFFPLASKSLKLSVSAESAKNWREGEVVRARLLRVRERTEGYRNTHENVRHSVRQSVQEGIQQGGRRQDLWQNSSQNPSQEARQGVKQGVTQGVTHNYSKHRFRTFAPILFAHPLESLGCFNGDIAFLCELGLRQHAAQRATDYMEIPRSPLSADEESTDEENLQVEAELEAIKPYVYSQEQKQQAQAGSAEPTREDLRELPFITIDGEDARDFDDAVMAEPIKPDTKNSNTKSSNTKNSDRAKFRLRIAIADVALYVKADSQLDKRARARGNSIYLPDRVVAMLPARLSENLCSLQPQRERPCLMVEIIIDARGRVLKQRVARVVIKSKARVTYEQVERILENKKHETEVEKLVENLYLAWMALAIARKERGALEINRSEPVPILKKTDSGRIDCTNIAERHNSNARRIIEDFMIAANVAIASHLNNSYLNKSQSKATKKKTSLKEINQGVNKGVKQEIKKELGFVIRNHEPPTLEKWQALQEELGRLKDACSSVPSLQSLRESGSQAQKMQAQKTQGQKTQAQKMQSLDSSDRLAEQRRQQLSALLQDVQAKTLQAKTLQAKTLQAKKSAKENAEQSPSPIFDYLPLLVAEVVLRAQSQARYATTNPQHFALALPNYCHFTSPIRRYADLLVHRAVLASLENKRAGESRKNALKISPELCEHLVACERSAIALERITFQRIACHYLKNRIGEVVEGVVLKVMPFGFFVRLRELPVEGIVARESLEHYRFQYANEKVLVGKRSISFGSRIKVEIHESDPIVARLELKLKE